MWQYDPTEEINSEAANILDAFNTGVDKSASSATADWLGRLNQHIIPKDLENKTTIPVEEFEFNLNDVFDNLPTEIQLLNAGIHITRFELNNKQAYHIMIFGDLGNIAELNITQLDNIHTQKDIFIKESLQSNNVYQTLVSTCILAVRLFTYG